MKNMKKIGALVTAGILASISLTSCGLFNQTQTPDIPTTPYEEKGIVVTFDYNDETSRPQVYYSYDNASIAQPKAPTREGFQLSGWYTSEEGGEAVTFPYTPTANTTLYARWEAKKVDVTFDFNFENSEPYITQIAYGESVEAPDVSLIPENEGYVFYRWETQATGGEAVSFPYAVTDPVTFYAAWYEESSGVCTVKFDANYPDAPEGDSFTVPTGTKIRKRDVDEPSRAGYKFLGWSAESDATEAELTFPYTVERSTTFYAVWQKETYRVRFLYNYPGSPGGANDTVAYQDGQFELDQEVAEPTAPTREGFEFIGWYTAPAAGNKIEFPYAVKSSVGFYAHWRADRMTPNRNIFDAEFTPINPNYSAATFSGNVQGTQIITPGIAAQQVHSEPYPLVGNEVHSDNFVGGLYAKGASLTFTIYSDRACSATLISCMGVELLQSINITPNGEFGFEFLVNDVSLQYGSINVTGANATPTEAQFHSVFSEYTVGTISLVEGENTIVLRVNNSYTSSDLGAMRAMAPLVDYIRLDCAASLSWHPEYDNMYRSI